jgi:hypothetical protein
MKLNRGDEDIPAEGPCERGMKGKECAFSHLQGTLGGRESTARDTNGQQHWSDPKGLASLANGPRLDHEGGGNFKRDMIYF